jgi:PIN like domain
VTPPKAPDTNGSEEGTKPALNAGGLYAGFEAYRTPAEADYQHLLTSGMVVPDTNVLLNLYRYNDETRKDFFNVLSRIGDHLWVPHQVIAEFWNNREAVLRDPQGADATTQSLTSYRDGATGAIRAWSNRVRPQTEVRDNLIDSLTRSFQEVIDTVTELADEEAPEFARDTSKDRILTGLEPILHGRIGRPFTDAEHAEAVEEAARRRDAKEPPGYKDANKPGIDWAGDYLMWAQTLREAQGRKQDVLIVTGDVKDDWWRRENGEIRGPLPYLVNEMQEVAGTRLFMIRPESLLPYARQILDVDVREESVQDIERVAEGESGGWTSEAMNDFLSELYIVGWRTQEAVIRTAALRGGFIERETVYELGGYSEGRQLKGFTRPINRITREFRQNGKISESAIDVLQTEYEASGDMPAGWASGFRVPEVLIPLVLGWHDSWSAPMREPEPGIVAAALEDFRALGHDVDDSVREDDAWGQTRWPCRSCGSALTLVGLDGRWVSASGRGNCPGRAETDGGPGSGA